MKALRPPEHVRRARLARRVQLLLAVAGAGFVFYKLMVMFVRRDGTLP